MRDIKPALTVHIKGPNIWTRRATLVSVFDNLYINLIYVPGKFRNPRMHKALKFYYFGNYHMGNTENCYRPY